jgi:hypothetical protein
MNTKKVSSKKTTNNGDGMNVALKRKYERIKKLLAKNTTTTSSARYEIGRLVNEVSDEKQFGDHAVKKLALALDRDEDSLYEYGKVAEAWTEAQFEKLAARRSANGMPLTFSHFVELAKAPEEKRASLTADALAKGYSFRQLRDARTGGKKPVTPASQLKTALRSSKAALENQLGELVNELRAADVAQERVQDANELLDLLVKVRDATASGVEDLQAALTGTSSSGAESSKRAATA